jgi:putative FmdB family regulatory protein
MPTIEYTCKACHHIFSRVVLRGEEDRPAACPKCRGKNALPSRAPESLFNGISSFSTLAKDTN